MTENDYRIFNNEFLPYIKNLVDDYQVGIPESRDSEVLSLFAVMFKQMGSILNDFLQNVVFGLCSSTLEMIKQDMQQYPEFREGFFRLVQNIIKNCTDGYF
jgi:hypothetical protein